MMNESLEAKEDKRFRLDATINIAHILTTIAMVFALFNWGAGINQSLAVQEDRISAIQKDRERARHELREALAEISRKLDRLSERK